MELSEAPYTLDWFWKKVESLKGLPHNFTPLAHELVICGVAGSSSFKYFSDTDGYSEFAYALYTGRWYNVAPEGELSFRDGMLLTHFKNATCPMAALPSFLSEIRNTVVDKTI